jgi:hypothetical protein
MPESVSAVTQIVMLDSSGVLGIPNGKHDLVIIVVHAMTELYFILLNTLLCELKIYHIIVTCLKCACCACYTVISSLCISRLCLNLKTNVFISIVLPNILCLIEKESVFDQYVVNNTTQYTVISLCKKM